MTLFEYLAVSVAIVLSLGVVRLLDGLPQALTRGRRYWVHSLWVVNVLWLHAQFWWTFWSYNRVEGWTYPGFLVSLAAPVLLYSLAITLAPGRSEAVESWRLHFYRVRLRFCVLFALWFVAVGLATWAVLGQPFLHPLRANQAGFVVLFSIGAVSQKPKVHAAIALLFAGLMVFGTLTFFLQAAPLLE